MLPLSGCASSITSPVLINLIVFRTVCGLMWLAAPRSSPAPHFDGQRALSAGGDHDGAWAEAGMAPKSKAERANVKRNAAIGYLPRDFFILCHDVPVRRFPQPH